MHWELSVIEWIQEVWRSQDATICHCNLWDRWNLCLSVVAAAEFLHLFKFHISSCILRQAFFLGGIARDPIEAIRRPRCLFSDVPEGFNKLTAGSYSLKQSRRGGSDRDRGGESTRGWVKAHHASWRAAHTRLQSASSPSSTDTELCGESHTYVRW